MKGYFLFFILFASLIAPQISHAQPGGNADAIDILRKFSEKQRTFSDIGYVVNYRYINSEIDDSVYTAKAWVWLSFKTTDTIFGSLFHVKSENKNGSYDYFYDGFKGYEVYHPKRTVTVINPYSYPNNSNNPAKARPSLRGLYSLLSKRDIADFLFVNYPFAKNPKATIQSLGEDWILRVAYPANPSGALISFELLLTKNDLRLRRSKRVSLWNGTQHTEIFELDSIVTDQAVVREHIPVTSDFEGYTINEQEKKSSIVLSTGNREGNTAPAFRYPLVGGGFLSLNDLKGKYVVLDFWETWCGACILAIPELKASYQKYRGRNVEFLGITTENFSGVERVISRNQITYPQLKADNEIVKNYGLIARPIYVLVDKEGKILIYDDWKRIEKFLDQL